MIAVVDADLLSSPDLLRGETAHSAALSAFDDDPEPWPTPGRTLRGGRPFTTRPPNMVSVIHQVFLRTAEATEPLLQHHGVASRWNEPSALDEYTVGALAGHLARAVLTVRTYLDAPEAPSGCAPKAAADYFLSVLAAHDPIESDFHRAVRRRGAQTAAEGPRALAEQFHSARRGLERRLDRSVLERRVEVLDGLVLTVGEYLRTRVLELVVHHDDLAVSVGLDRSAKISEEAYRVTAGLLGEIAAVRVGGAATVRSLARRERRPAAVRAL